MNRFYSKRKIYHPNYLTLGDILGWKIVADQSRCRCAIVKGYATGENGPGHFGFGENCRE